MKSWVFYERRYLNNRAIEFSVDIWEGDKRLLTQEEVEDEKGYIRTIPSTNAFGLAKRIIESNLEIEDEDILTSPNSPIFSPKNSYMDAPVTADKIKEFYGLYYSFLSSKKEQ